jgi:hypothetical protein
VSIAQTSQLLQLILNSAVMMVIALVWWGVIVFRLNTVSNQMRRINKRYRRIPPDDNQKRVRLRLRQHRHDLTVRYRLTRHSVLIMHYVLMAQMASLFLLSLRALVNSNFLITMALFMFVMGTAGILLSVALALMEFYQLNVLTEYESSWTDLKPAPAAIGSIAPQYQITPQVWSQTTTQAQGLRPEGHQVDSIAS